MRSRVTHAFTLIELLVVIAIIALLVSILLPALGKARSAARLTQSQNSIRNIAWANDSYRADNRGWLPYMVAASRVPATWSHGGKNCTVRWANGNNANWYDFAGADRPLNKYLASAATFETPLTASNRAGIETPIFRSPGDKYSGQYDWPKLDTTISCYDDVGTSYHYNGLWYNSRDPFDSKITYNPFQGFTLPSVSEWSANSYLVSRQFGKWLEAASVNPSTFVMYHDQTVDLIANHNGWKRLVGEFGDTNRAVMSFLDSHVDYLTVTTDAPFGDGVTMDINKSKPTQSWKYTCVFPLLGDPRTKLPIIKNGKYPP